MILQSKQFAVSLDMIQIPAACVEFVEGGNTIWVHGPQGATILRIKTSGKITVNPECENICSHSDIMATGDIQICLADDAIPLPEEMMGS